MAFVSGNLGKEILQKAMKNANIRPNTASIRIQKPTPKPSQRENQNQSPIVPKIDTLATRASSNPKIDEPMQSPTLLPYRNIPNEQVKCSCHVCQEKNGIKMKPQTAQVVAKPRMNVQEGNNKGFSHILKLMLPDRGNAPKGLKFLIADTLVFTGGEPRFFMYNSRNKYIRFIKQKDKLALPEMKKFFLARKQRKELDGINFFNENTMTMKHKIKDWKLKAQQEKDTERFLGAYEKSHNPQNSPSRNKEKRIQDTTAHREIVICKYTDESLQVLSELDFSYLMMKRKIEPVWLQLDYIQSYIKLKKEHPYYVRVDYDHDRDIKNPFYERAREFVYYMSQEREPELEGFDYTTAEDIFEEDLKNANIYEYCQYLNFKFVCYLDAYCAARVKHMITEYAWEDTNLVYLVNAYDIKFFNIAEQDYILREVDIVNEEEKQKANDRIYNNKSSPYQGKVEVLWAFRQYYEDMKSDLDINKEFEETILENPTSNEAFKIINPETTFTLYDVMTNVKEFEKFKAWLQNRSMEPGKLGKLFKSALKFAETSATANMSKASAATKIQKSSTHRQTNRNEPGNDNAAKLFQKKMKILDICGNGVSRKKYIHTSEVLYRSDVVSGRKIIANDSTTTRSKMTSPMMSDQSTGRGLTATPSRQFRIRSQKTPTPGGGGGQSGFDLSILNKTKSLASMLYVKPDQL